MVFEEKYHQYAIDAIDMRNIGDYGSMFSVEKEKADEMIKHAEEAISAIEKYLSGKWKNHNWTRGVAL